MRLCFENIKYFLLRPTIKFIGQRDNIIRWILNCFTQETDKDLKLFVVLGTAYGFGKERSIKEANNQGKNQWGFKESK